MITKIIKFEATDGILLNGILNKHERNTDKILIQIHGMTSNCFKKREKIIADKVSNLNIDTLCFNNRGSEIIKYCKNKTGEKILQGTAYENIEDSYFDILGAIKYIVELGYKQIYLQGHSLGSTKIIYVYNKLLDENNPYLKYVKSIILLSLIDIPDMLKTFTPKEFIDLANKMETENKLEELMPLECSIHPFSVRTYLKYIKYYENIDFARYSDKNYDYEKINKIKIPLFIRWGNNKELIKQNAEDLVYILKNKLSNTKLDISYIDGANHSYNGKEDVLAQEIYDFLNKI